MPCQLYMRLCEPRPDPGPLVPPVPCLQPSPAVAPAANFAATSNFTFLLLNNVADFTPEVEQQVAADLAAQLQLPASQVILAPPAIIVEAALQLAAFPPGRENDVRAGIVEYLGAGDAGEEGARAEDMPGASDIQCWPGLVWSCCCSSRWLCCDELQCWPACSCVPNATLAAAATNVTQRAAAAAANRRRCASPQSRTIPAAAVPASAAAAASRALAVQPRASPLAAACMRHAASLTGLLSTCVSLFVHRLRAERAPATNFDVEVTTTNATLASQVEVGAAAAGGAATVPQCNRIAGLCAHLLLATAGLDSALHNRRIS